MCLSESYAWVTPGLIISLGEIVALTFRDALIQCVFTGCYRMHDCRVETMECASMPECLPIPREPEVTCYREFTSWVPRWHARGCLVHRFDMVDTSGIT
ncbi:hypothetical protein F511_23996 [Dorcoceras hygrometricum]|uniref:Uncharacterized protein n=1 Tax=Dorcoceras hygrometricum TaxID=472368 RepID=A0A2Z7BF51_9LAMI|nr:hypothetical protein F511_23996 [Dorcoceras hygrometricum]